MSDQTKVYRWHQFDLRTLMFLAFMFALPFGIWEFKKNRVRQFAKAASPFRNCGAVVASNPRSVTEFLTAYLFLGSDHLVTSISFMDEPLTDQRLDSLRENFRTVPRLNRILLENTKITDQGLLCISELDQLTCLRLDGTAITDVGVERIRNLTQMRELGLARTEVTDGCIANLRGMSRLRSLHLSDTRITDEGLAALQDFKTLEFLSLRNTAVTDEGIASLSSLSDLETLDLGNTKITDECLADLQRLASLRGLSIDGTQLSEDGVVRLKNALPDCRVWNASPN